MAPQWLTIVAKFGDHLPFYRQAEIFKRQGINLDRSTLGNWVGRACFHLMPVINHMRAHLRGAPRIFVDETHARQRQTKRQFASSGVLIITGPYRRSAFLHHFVGHYPGDRPGRQLPLIER